MQNSKALIQEKAVTSREHEILYLIAWENSTKEIADILSIDFETVKTHRSNLLQKFNVKNVAGLIWVAFEKKLLKIDRQINSSSNFISKTSLSVV